MMGAPSTMGPPAVTPRKPPTTPSQNSFAFGVTPHKTPLRTPGGSKIEQTSSTPVIDFNAIESQKENVQPLAKGRSAHALSNTLNMQHQQRQALLSQQRAEHESIVTSEDNGDSDDPLEAWTKYVKWCIDNYPSGQTHESGLIPLLERATRHFRHSEQYTNDPRYLRLWILYARNVECARDVYNFLLANEISTKLASLYEELAVVLEGQRMYDEADAMYRLGIARRANPIDRIKRRYEEYKTRIIVGQQALAESSGSGASGIVCSYGEALKAAMNTAGRSMLGEKEASVGPVRSHSANVLRGAGASIGAIGSNALTPSNNGRKLNVLHDDDDDDDDHRPARSTSKPGHSTKGWQDIGTAASRNQENLQADRLAGIHKFKIGVSGGLSKKPGSGLAAAVFRDSDDDEVEDQAEQVPSTPKLAGVLSPKDHFKPGLGRKAQSSETDLLRSNPFAYWGKDAKLKPDPASLRPAASDSSDARKVSSSDKSKSEKLRTKTTVSRASQPSASSSSAAASAATSGKREKHAAPVAQMYPPFRSATQKAFYKQRGWASELTLEQLTARLHGFASAIEGWQDDATPADPWSHLDEVVGRWLPEPPVEPSTTVAIDQTTGMFPLRDVFDPDNSVANAVALNLRPGPRRKKKRDGENTTKLRMSPTLVTKATLLEVENMFNGDSESDEDSSDDDGDDDDDSEEDDYVAPLSSVSRAGFMRVELGSAADVPPTPTPLSRSNHPPKLDVQNDENAGVTATPLRTPGAAPRLGLGGVTPMRTPLAAKSSLSTLGSRPVYREEDEDEDDETAELRAQSQLAAELAKAPVFPKADSAPLPATIPATPMPSQRQPAARRWIEPMAEEDEEEEEVEEEQEQEAEGEEEYVDESGHPIADAENHDHLFRPQFQPLTPITEATFEFTRYTSARTPGTATRSAKSWRPLTQDDEDEEDEGPSKILTTGPIASHARVAGQDAADESQVNSDERSFASTSGEGANHSDWNADNKASFELTKGLTIRCAPEDEEEEGELHERFEDSLVIDEPQRDAEGFVPSNPCSPVDPQVLNAILARLPTPLEAQANFVDLTSNSSEDLLSNLQKKCKSTPLANQMTRKSMGGTVFHGTSVLTTPFTARIGGDEYEIRGKLGEGGYGAVFLGFDVNSAATSAGQEKKVEEDSDEDDEDDEDRHRQVAIKVESPASRWEFHILTTLASRLPTAVLPSVISARKLYCYSDASFLLLDLGEMGTLLDVVNNATNSGVAPSSSAEGAGGVEEILALFFTAELLRTILALHRAGIIHGDLKIDNCLLRLADVIPSSAWSNIYSRAGNSGWSAKGLTLIDFGRAIDTTAFPEGQNWIADWETDAKDCFEMRAGRPFAYETDWFGLAAVAHCLLFGKYLDTRESAGRHELTASFKRYWQSNLWQPFFDTCLNPQDLTKDQVLGKLDECLLNMQSWLEANSNKGGKNLKGLLRKLEIWAMKQGH